MKQKRLIDKKFKLNDLISSIVKENCLVCGKSLKELGNRTWHIPLCKEHRKITIRETIQYDTLNN